MSMTREAFDALVASEPDTLDARGQRGASGRAAAGHRAGSRGTPGIPWR